ncbi:MAG: hypothetical protein WC861_00575 [Candidatus Micrarchaeia archaeon]|jgi:hypothetical protein
MKGQYFSFDAIIATVIMVLAFSSLVAYWYGAQAVVESRAYSRLADANRVAESLLSPGSPADWAGPSYSINDVRQAGIATGFGNELNMSKVDKLQEYANLSSGYYEATGNLLRAGGDYFILIEQADDSGGLLREIGSYPIPANASYVAVATRGVTFRDAGGNSHPARMRVFLWKQ